VSRQHDMTLVWLVAAVKIEKTKDRLFLCACCEEDRTLLWLPKRLENLHRDRSPAENHIQQLSFFFSTD
jgi:hypothetical protein